MAESSAPSPPRPAAAPVEQQVVEIVRELASEVGGPRAARAVTPLASLERELGLGSLERVELLLRLERAFGQTLDDTCLELDTPAALARAVLAADGRPRTRPEADSRTTALRAASPIAGARTIQEVLWIRAREDPDRPHVFLREQEGDEHTVSYGRLLAAAAAVASGLRERGVGRGDTLALMLPTGFDFLRSFQGALLAGAVPVPIYPPARLDRLEEYAERQAAILRNAEVRVLVTIDRARPVAALLKGGVPSLRHVVTADELDAGGSAWSEPEGLGADPAFVQYTSGSTGQPKGVLLTHDNLLANIRAIGAGVGVRPDDVGVSWLPLYHDMGLIGAWLFCMFHGIPIDIQSPLAFLARPERWLWAIHRRRATLSPAPNFAYELCVRRIPDAALEGLDLSSWRCALNGAEPVSPDTLERFAARFAGYGFRREALLPVYGLAENSVALCFPPAGRGPRLLSVERAGFEQDARAEDAADPAAGLTFVSVGTPLPEHEVRIVDDTGADVPERRVGRLIFRGPSMTPGYLRQPEATAAITVGDGWLDSGDLAFVAEGELYIAGRSKDLIIKGGRNLVPQEIEEVAAGVDGVRRGCVVAFGVTRSSLGTESLVIVAETRVADAARRDAIVSAVNARVTGALGLPPDTVQLVPPGAVPKTSSGKIRRAATRELYLAGELGRVRRTPLAARARLVLAAAWAEAVGRLRLLPRALYLGWIGVVALCVFLPLWLVAMALPAALAVRLARFGARAILSLLGCPASSHGLERLPQTGPAVIVCNHASYADVPALMALLPTDVLFVAKKEVLAWPFVGPYVRKTRQIAVERYDQRQSVADADQIARALAAGRRVLVFPEGTFTATPGLRPFRLGAFKAATESRAPIAPIALQGTRRVLHGDGGWPRPGRIRLWIGEPIPAADDGWRAVVELRDRTAAAIAAECGEPRLDMVAAGPVRE